MDNNVSRKKCKIFIAINIYFLVSASFLVKANELDRDYFLSKNKKDVGITEKYHLSQKFWDNFVNGNDGEVLADLNFILRYFPNHPKALSVLSRFAVLKEMYSLPIKHFQKALRLFPQHAYTHAQYGKYLAENGNDDVLIREGIAELKKSIVMNPKLTESYVWLANAYFNIGNIELAIQTAEKAKDLGSQDEKLDKILKNNP